MNDQLKEYGLNFAKVMILLIVLLLPSLILPGIIENSGYREISQNFECFYTWAGSISAYFFIMICFHERFVSRLLDMVTLKYLIVILSIFWICYDFYMTYIFQKVYLQYQDLIISRDIVWRDLEVLPDHVIYSNLAPTLKLFITGTRGIFVGLILFKLVKGKKDPLEQSKYLRRKIKKKSFEEVKKGLHPSILKQYENSDKTK